jgi:thiamine-monophosphate kinase
LLGVGDDCALLRPDAGLDLAVTTDMLVEGRHFLPGAEPRALGHKALAVKASLAMPTPSSLFSMNGPT